METMHIDIKMLDDQLMTLINVQDECKSYRDKNTLIGVENFLSQLLIHAKAGRIINLNFVNK